MVGRRRPLEFSQRVVSVANFFKNLHIKFRAPLLINFCEQLTPMLQRSDRFTMSVAACRILSCKHEVFNRPLILVSFLKMKSDHRRRVRSPGSAEILNAVGKPPVKTHPLDRRQLAVENLAIKRVSELVRG